MRLIKGESSVWMNRSKLMKTRFEWQDDYFVTSVSNSHVDRVRRYIKNQDEHHRKLTWDEEVDLFLKRYGFERMKG
jgi:REP element-mobilizing transposase RayT